MGTPPHRAFTYVFGPVPSRRLGLSLGVDMAPRKVCSFDCVYCQVGRTDRLTVQRERFTPPETILAELAEKLKVCRRPDYITLSGSGEPTLNAALEEIITGIRRVTEIPIAILTNGSLLRDADVRRACASADVVLPTLDAADEATFRAIHRPAEGITLEGVIEGLEAFRREFAGQIWIEVFLIDGVNADEESVRRLRPLLDRVNPDRIQLNTAVRPTADAGVTALSEERLTRLAALLGPKTEVIADFRRPEAAPEYAAREEAILEMVRRRPVTLDDIAAGLGLPAAEAHDQVKALLAKGRVSVERRGAREFFHTIEK